MILPVFWYLKLQSKIDRFQKWRGSRAAAEQNYLDVAMLISNYVDSVTSLDVIKAEAEKKFKELDHKKGRYWGAVVYSKLIIDDALEHLTDTATQEKILLAHSSKIISILYDNWKDDTKANILKLLQNMEQLLSIESVSFSDQNQYKSFFLSMYMLFHIIRLTLDKIDWKIRLIAEYLVDLRKMEHDVGRALQIIEKKANQELQTKELGRDEDDNADPLKPIKNHLSKRYLKVLNSSPLVAKSREIKNGNAPKPLKRDIFASLNELEKDVAKVSSAITSMLELRAKKEEIEKKIEKITTFLSASEESRRNPFFDFIKNHADSYQILLNNIEVKRKEQHLEKINQLKASFESMSISTGVLTTVSWVATPLTKVYQTVTPQIAQNMIKSVTSPYTLEGICYADLKEMAQIFLDDLQQKLKKREYQITVIGNRFFHQNEELKKLIAEESIQGLMDLRKANDIMQTGIQSSCKLLTSVKENADFLHDLKKKNEVLNEFIRVNDGFFLKICHFMAHFFSFFKTNTAIMIEKAIVLQKKIDGLENKYQLAVNQGLQQVDHCPELSKNIKINIKKRFKAEQGEMSQDKQKAIAPNRRNVSLLMRDLSLLFSKNPHVLEKGNCSPNVDINPKHNYSLS